MGTWELMFHEDTELISQTAASGFHVKITARIRSTVHRFPCDQFDRDKWNLKPPRWVILEESFFLLILSYFPLPSAFPGTTSSV